MEKEDYIYFIICCPCKCCLLCFFWSICGCSLECLKCESCCSSDNKEMVTQNVEKI